MTRTSTRRTVLARRWAVALAGLLLFVAAAPRDDERPTFWQIAEALGDEGGTSSTREVVLEHMAGVYERRQEQVGPVLSRVVTGLTQPWTPPALAADLRDVLAAPAEARRGAARYDGLFDAVGERLDLTASDLADREQRRLAALEEQWQVVADPALVGDDLLAALSTLMQRAHLACEHALSDLSIEQRRLLFEDLGRFREGWYRSHEPGVELPDETVWLLEDVKAQLLADPRHDLAALLAVARMLARLGEPDFTKGLAKRLKTVSRGGDVPDGFDRDITAVVGDAPSARVVLGGKRASTYVAPAALIIDVGGGDRYERAACVDAQEMLASVVLDLAGDDEYESAGAGAACATGGVALLFDLDGDDEHRCGRLGQAAATLGVSLLLDADGDDTYVMEDYGQGHALSGVALFHDLAGDDTYEAWAYAQGGNLAGGLAALVDGDGDDTYLADGHWPDVYGNSGPDIFHGASQGYATGLRPEVAGGIGVLLDLGAGKDRYQAGNFSQGGGYYFAFGLMHDGGGDDENHGCRYAQGFGVHQAVGVRWDADGDDTYTCRSVANCGMAWDEGVGYLLEDGGDDTYQVGDLGCGGAAQTGVAVLLEADGKDTYRCGRESLGLTGASEYHGKPALALMIDVGGDKDGYAVGGRGDGESQATEGGGLFVDAKAKTLAKLRASLR